LRKPSLNTIESGVSFGRNTTTSFGSADSFDADNGDADGGEANRDGRALTVRGAWGLERQTTLGSEFGSGNPMTSNPLHGAGGDLVAHDGSRTNNYQDEDMYESNSASSKMRKRMSTWGRAVAKSIFARGTSEEDLEIIDSEIIGEVGDEVEMTDIELNTNLNAGLDGDKADDSTVSTASAHKHGKHRSSSSKRHSGRGKPHVHHHRDGTQTIDGVHCDAEGKPLADQSKARKMVARPSGTMSTSSSVSSLRPPSGDAKPLPPGAIVKEEVSPPSPCPPPLPPPLTPPLRSAPTASCAGWSTWTGPSPAGARLASGPSASCSPSRACSPACTLRT
jgi:hypothetical protein